MKSDENEVDANPSPALPPYIKGPNGFDLRVWLAQLPRSGWKADMVRQLPDAFRFEIIDGELLLPEYVYDPTLPVRYD